MDGIHDRIALIISTKGMTNADFAEKIEVQPSNISHIMSGRNKPSLDLVMKIMKRFPELRTEWLLHGKGAMNKDYSLFDAAEPTPAKKQETLFFPAEMDLEERQVGGQNDIPQPPPVIKTPVEPENIVENKDIPYFEGRQEGRKKEIKVNLPAKGKKLEKIVLFYDDQTFKEYFPSE